MRAAFPAFSVPGGRRSPGEGEGGGGAVRDEPAAEGTGGGSGLPTWAPRASPRPGPAGSSRPAPAPARPWQKACCHFTRATGEGE